MTVPAMTRKMLASVPYLRARRAYIAGRIPDALRHHSIALRFVARPIDKAFHATLLILDHRSSDAQSLFREAIAEIRDCEDNSETHGYILNYCRYFEALISGEDADRFRVAAEALAVHHRLDRLLPFPPEACDA
jgi:hypothetical protein